MRSFVGLGATIFRQFLAASTINLHQRQTVSRKLIGPLNVLIKPFVSDKLQRLGYVVRCSVIHLVLILNRIVMMCAPSKTLTRLVEIVDHSEPALRIERSESDRLRPRWNLQIWPQLSAQLLFRGHQACHLTSADYLQGRTAPQMMLSSSEQRPPGLLPRLVRVPPALSWIRYSPDQLQ